MWAIRAGVDEIYAAQIEQYELKNYAKYLKTAFGVSPSNSFYQIVEVAWNGIKALWPNIFTLRWLHTFQNGFALAIPLAIAGVIIYVRRKETGILLPIIMLLPVALIYQLVNQAGGRMLFTGFPAIIAFALIAVREILKRVSYRNEA